MIARVCKNGHAVEGGNAYIRPNGTKIECRACRTARYVAYSSVEVAAGSTRRRESRERRKIIIEHLREGHTPEQIVAETGFTKKLVSHAISAAQSCGVLDKPAPVKKRPYTAPSHLETWREFRMRKHHGKPPVTKVPWPEYSVHVNDPWQEDVPLCQIR